MEVGHLTKIILKFTLRLNYVRIAKKMFIATQFTIAKCWKQLKCPSVNEWIKNYGTFPQWNTMQQKERRNSYHS